MKKDEFYINTIDGKNNFNYLKVSGYVEEVVDSKGNILMIGYDKRDDDSWIATELNTGFRVSRGTLATKKECVENVHENIDTIVEVYNQIMIDKKRYNKFIKPFKDFVDTNKGVKV